MEGLRPVIGNLVPAAWSRERKGCNPLGSNGREEDELGNRKESS